MLEITVTPTAIELIPTTGHALSWASIEIVENGFPEAPTIKQIVAVAGEKYEFWVKVAPGNKVETLEVK